MIQSVEIDSVFTIICWAGNHVQTRHWHYSEPKHAVVVASSCWFTENVGWVGGLLMWPRAHTCVLLRPKLPPNLVWAIKPKMRPQYVLRVFTPVFKAIHLWLDHSGRMVTPGVNGAFKSQVVNTRQRGRLKWSVALVWQYPGIKCDSCRKHYSSENHAPKNSGNRQQRQLVTTIYIQVTIIPA